VVPSIKHPEADRLARELARRTGETITEAVTLAIRDRLQRIRARKPGRSLVDELDEIARHCAALPVLDDRSPEDIIGYDERGVPV